MNKRLRLLWNEKLRFMGLNTERRSEYALDSEDQVNLHHKLKPGLSEMNSSDAMVRSELFPKIRNHRFPSL